MRRHGGRPYVLCRNHHYGGLRMGGSLRTDDGKPATSVFRRRITVFDRLTNKQCAMLLALIAGMLFPVILLVALNLVEWLFSATQIWVVSFLFIVIVFRNIIRDNSDDEDQEEEYFA